MLKKYALLILVLISFSLLSGVVFSEATGNITLGVVNITAPPTTGLFGHTIQYCNISAHCIDTANYKCFLDYDGTSVSPWQGWCNSTSITNCYVNGTAYTTGTKICDTSTSYRTCTTGNWSSSTSCGVNQTCSGGTCSTVNATSSSSTGGDGTTSTAITTHSSITVSAAISDFNMTQNTTASKILGVKNNGNTTQYNLTIAVSGLDSSWYSFLPEKYDTIYKNKEYNFTISFSIPHNAEVKTYTITATASTSNTSVTATNTFSLKVLPSNETIEKEIRPNYELYASMLQSLKDNITDLETKGADVTNLRSMYGDIEAKLNQTNSSLASKNYYNANILLNEIKTLINTLETDIEATEILPKAEPQQPTDMILIIIVIVIIAVVLFLLYLFWPTEEKKGFRPSLMWKEGKKKGFLDKIKELFKKEETVPLLAQEGPGIAHGLAGNLSKLFKKKKKEKKKERGAFRYDFRR